MNQMNQIVCGAILLARFCRRLAQYPGWQHSGSLYLLTRRRRESAGLSFGRGLSVVGAAAQGLVRFHAGKGEREDIRFSSSAGAPLAYQIEEWDAAKGAASIWVRVR